MSNAQYFNNIIIIIYYNWISNSDTNCISGWTKDIEYNYIYELQFGQLKLTCCLHFKYRATFAECGQCSWQLL